MTDHPNDQQHHLATASQVDACNELVKVASQMAEASRAMDLQIVAAAALDAATSEKPETNGVDALNTFALMRRIRWLAKEVQQLEQSCENLAERRRTVGKETALKVLENQELLSSIMQASRLRDVEDSELAVLLQQSVELYCT